MNPDPIEKLARFTPASGDHLELLFAAGRASARTPWFWKAGLAASVIANAVCLGFLAFRSPEVQTIQVPAEPAPVPLVAPQTGPETVVPAVSPPDPFSFQALRDMDRFPAPEVFSDSGSAKPLSVMSAHSGEID